MASNHYGFFRDVWLSMPATCSTGNTMAIPVPGSLKRPASWMAERIGFDHGVADQEKNHLGADVQAESEKRFRLPGTRSGSRDDGRPGRPGLFGRIDDLVGQVGLHHCKDAFIGH